MGQRSREHAFFRTLFQNLKFPIIACEDGDTYDILYINESALLLLQPLLSTEKLIHREVPVPLQSVLCFRDPELLSRLLERLAQAGSLDDVQVEVLSYEKIAFPVTLYANRLARKDRTYCLFYLFEANMGHSFSSADINSFLTNAFSIAYRAEDLEDGIDQLLAYIGAFLSVDRVYIFEERSEETLCNTYEWCAAGITPQRSHLQQLRKDACHYGATVQGGMYIAEDVRKLPEADQAHLLARGVQSLAVIPLMDGSRPIGYVGLDDCHSRRSWSTMEIMLLKSTSNLLLTLLSRRDANQQVVRGLEVLQLVTDHSSYGIYVNDVKSYELIFVNKTLADSLGTTVEALLGWPCWQVLQKDRTGPCDFCPMPKLLEAQAHKARAETTWEFQNTRNQRWYMLQESLITWIDGRIVHIESSMDISVRKAYEAQLEHFASYDTMTNTYNREWGYRLLAELRRDPTLDKDPVSLIFVDLDGLKSVNDHFGHAAGDEMIRETVEILRASVRKDDLICRWGGDEFIMAIRCDLVAARRILEDIERRMAMRNARTTKPYAVSVSFGLVRLTPISEGSLDVLISLADQQMYQNKMEKRRSEPDPSRT